MIAILEVGIPALFSYFVWRVLGLDKAPLSLGGAVAVFLSGALSSWVWWGHAGPVWTLDMLLTHANGEYVRWAMSMTSSGLCMIALFGWLSFRKSRARGA